MSSDQKQLNKNLLVFDFDETIIDQDSEYAVAKKILPEEYEKIVEMDKVDYSGTFNYLFKRMKDIGLTLEDYNKRLDELELSPKMEELFDFLRKNKSKYEMIIVSGDIDYPIRHILDYHGILDLFDDFIFKSCEVKGDNAERLIYVPKVEFRHGCNLCVGSQCKGLDLQNYLEKNNYKKYDKIIFVCDGGNDFCPSKTILREGDIVFPRVELGLYKKLYEKNLKDETICRIFPWKSADEIISKLKEL